MGEGRCYMNRVESQKLQSVEEWEGLLVGSKFD